MSTAPTPSSSQNQKLTRNQKKKLKKKLKKSLQHHVEDKVGDKLLNSTEHAQSAAVAAEQDHVTTNHKEGEEKLIKGSILTKKNPKL